MNNDIFLTVEIELNKSLPMFNRDGEIVFFYDTEELNKGFAITEVRYVFKKANDFEPYHRVDFDGSSLFENSESSCVISTVLGADALNESKNYCSNFEKFKAFAYGNREIGDEEISVMLALKKSFNRLVPPSLLKDIYYKLGKDMFNFIDSELKTYGKK